MSHRGIEKELVFFPNKILFGSLTVNTELGCEKEIPFLNNCARLKYDIVGTIANKLYWATACSAQDYFSCWV